MDSVKDNVQSFRKWLTKPMRKRSHGKLEKMGEAPELPVTAPIKPNTVKGSQTTPPNFSPAAFNKVSNSFLSFFLSLLLLSFQRSMFRKVRLCLFSTYFIDTRIGQGYCVLYIKVVFSCVFLVSYRVFIFQVLESIS